ncbi:MAG: hypothetical protein C0501_23450 [Isosphaera sp.]|nr:hypothetical protein [Isosphaera sp.]
MDEPSGWAAFFRTDPAATVDVLSVVADRFTPVTTFRDGKEIVGARRPGLTGWEIRAGAERPPVSAA